MKLFRSIKNIFGGSDYYDEDGKSVASSVPIIFGGETFIRKDGQTIGHSVLGIFGKTYYTNILEGDRSEEIPFERKEVLVDGVDYNKHKPSLSVTAEMDEIMGD